MAAQDYFWTFYIIHAYAVARMVLPPLSKMYDDLKMRQKKITQKTGQTSVKCGIPLLQRNGHRQCFKHYSAVQILFHGHASHSTETAPPSATQPSDLVGYWGQSRWYLGWWLRALIQDFPQERSDWWRDRPFLLQSVFQTILALIQKKVDGGGHQVAQRFLRCWSRWRTYRRRT